MRRFTYLIVLFALVAILAIVGCSSNSDKTDDLSTPAEQSTPTTTIESTPDLSGGSTAIPTTNTGTPNNGIAVGEPAPGFSPISLPTRTITFRANVPENTPDDEPVFLTIMDMTFGVDQRVEMKRLGNSTFEAKADVRDSAMIRYTYDRFE